MSAAIWVYIATAVVALVVLVTRARHGVADGRVRVPTLIANAHAAVGLVAVVVWTCFLIVSEGLGETFADVLGIIAIGLWWLLTVLGFTLVARWLPGGGKRAHVDHVERHNRIVGLTASAGGQFVVIVSVALFTYAYLTKIV